MNFEHLIEINDFSLPDVPVLSRLQLWQGLVLRAEQPELVLEGLESCVILERGADYIRREQDFGKVQVRDRVTFLDLEAVIYQTEASESLPAGQLTMKIEEPAPGSLFVRFTYASETAQGAAAEEKMYLEYLKDAYVQSDIATIAMIRELVASGDLPDGEVH